MDVILNQESENKLVAMLVHTKNYGRIHQTLTTYKQAKYTLFFYTKTAYTA